MFNWEHLIICIFFVSSLESIRNDFAYAEIAMLTYSLYSLWDGPINKKMLIGSFFGLIIPLESILNLEIICDFFTVFNRLQYHEYVYCAKCLCFLAISQACAYALQNKNLKRKNFHFFAFLVLVQRWPEYFHIMQFIIWISVVTIRMRVVPTYLKDVLHSSCPKDSFNHIFIMGSLTYSYYYLNEQEYLKLIISICIMDSAASIAGNLIKAKTRTYTGFVTGQISSWFAEYYLLGTVDFKYHVVMGIIEYLSPWIDNITLGLGSVLYQVMSRDQSKNR